MTQSEAAAHWQKRAKDEARAARALFEQGDAGFYGQVLFHCHLALELALKAEYIRRRNRAAPFTHSLNEIASLLEDAWTDTEHDAFDQLSEFAVLARYGDEQWFEKQATKEKAEEWLKKTEIFLSEIFP